MALSRKPSLPPTDVQFPSDPGPWEIDNKTARTRLPPWSDDLVDVDLFFCICADFTVSPAFSLRGKPA